jgi:hemerythrin
MAFIEWSSSLSVGLEEIDAQHRELIGLINSLSEAVGEGRDRATVATIFEALGNYALTHFGLEEKYFDEFRYAAAQAHKDEHAAFVRKIGEYKAEFSAGRAEPPEKLLAFLRTWLTNHIAFSDRKYKSLFAQKGIR